MPKVLFVDHPESDFLAALTYMGLCDLLGVDSVVDFPFKGSFHSLVDRYRLPPQQVWNVDGTIGTVYKDGLTAPLAWMRPTAAREWSLDEVCARMGEFSLVVASVRPFARDALARIRSRGGTPRIVVFDGEDSSTIKQDVIDQFRPAVYFKRHLVVEETRQRGETRVLPLPFSIANLCPSGMVGSLDRDGPLTDVVLLGGSNVPGGKGAYEDAIRCVTASYVFGQRSYEDMMCAVGLSRIVVAPRGLGQDTLRMWEFLGVEGPLVAIQRHTLVEVDPLVDGRHVAWFGSSVELETIVRTYLADEPLRQQVAAQGFAFAREKHTVKARVEYLLRESGV